MFIGMGQGGVKYCFGGFFAKYSLFFDFFKQNSTNVLIHDTFIFSFKMSYWFQ